LDAIRRNCAKQHFELCNHSKASNVQANMNRISASTWAEIRTAYASGIGLRQLARNMNIPAGTVLARSKREEWTQQIAHVKLIERPERTCRQVSPWVIFKIQKTWSSRREVPRISAFRSA
jgi:hypothetical protein